MSVSRITENLRQYKNKLNEKLTGKLKGFSVNDLTNAAKTGASKIRDTLRKVNETYRNAQLAIMDKIESIGGGAVLETLGIREYGLEVDNKTSDTSLEQLKRMLKNGDLDRIINKDLWKPKRVSTN
jgi:hypothetical protein